jgi:hypothetical protein
MSKRNPYSTLTRESFLKLLAERAKAPLATNGKIPTARDGAEPMFRHYPRWAALFPTQCVFAKELFERGLASGFAHSFWYNSVGSMVDHLVPLGKTLRAVGIQNPDIDDWVDEERIPEFIRDVLADQSSTLPWISFDEVYLLVEIAGVHAIIEINADIKCSSFGFLAPETTPEEALIKFNSMVGERAGPNGLSNIISIDQMEDPKSVSSDNVPSQVVELPPSAFIKGQLKFNGALWMFD